MRLGQIKRFGDYTFPETIIQFNDNFANVVPQTVRLAGLDGGWNEDGTRRSPSQIGQVTLNLYHATQDESQMDALRDALRAVAQYGEQKLVYQPTNGGRERFCRASLQYISDSRASEDTTRVLAQVSIYFQVMYPRWLDGQYLPATLGDGFDLSDGLTLGDNAFVINASGTETSTTVTNEGNADALVRISVVPVDDGSCENTTIERIVSSAVVDQVRYEGVLTGAGEEVNIPDELFIDGRRRIVELNAENAFNSNFSYLDRAFMRLAPGDNTIKVLFENSGDAATVRLWYAHTYN